jgi:hypothetical protein
MAFVRVPGQAAVLRRSLLVFIPSPLPLSGFWPRGRSLCLSFYCSEDYKGAILIFLAFLYFILYLHLYFKDLTLSRLRV